MAHSMRLAGSEPEGAFEHAASRARFTIRNTESGPWQTIRQAGSLESLPISFEIGSGSHAFGYVVQVGDHLFQSPLSYYSVRRIWDMAPGYEQSTNPDFSRPVTPECLFCHSDQPRPVPNTLNTYKSPPFIGTAIQCDRCHGPADAHLARPVPGSIINPAKLPPTERDSICEQCHLTGEIRIPNPGKEITEYRPGQTIEETYTIYVARHGPEEAIKVVSHVEQLALSVCARNSNGKMWCGTCHNPHETPVRPAEYFRERCLVCHAATLEASHAAPSQNCIACHMPRRPAKDGGHTAFTDHRISRRPTVDNGAPSPGELTAWREPQASLRERNLALALVTWGLENRSSNDVIRGYRMLNKLENSFPNDPAVLAALGAILLTAKQPAEAIRRFERASALRPDSAPYELDLAGALLDQGDVSAATRHLERALQLDPLLQQAVQMLYRTYLAHGQAPKAEDLMNRYRRAMGFAATSSK